MVKDAKETDCGSCGCSRPLTLSTIPHSDGMHCAHTCPHSSEPVEEMPNCGPFPGGNEQFYSRDGQPVKCWGALPPHKYKTKNVNHSELHVSPMISNAHSSVSGVKSEKCALLFPTLHIFPWRRKNQCMSSLFQGQKKPLSSRAFVIASRDDPIVVPPR